MISEVPEGAGTAQNIFTGFYSGEELLAVLDLITGYPEKDDVLIGWFMVSATHHRKGIGSQLFADVRAAMKAQGFTHLTLNCPAAAEDAIAFWENQGFRGTVSATDENIVIMSRDIV